MSKLEVVAVAVATVAVGSSCAKTLTAVAVECMPISLEGKLYE